MSEQRARSFELSLDEIALLENALQDYEDSLRHEAQLEQDLVGSDTHAQQFTTQADEVSRLRAKVVATTETRPQ